VSADGHDGDEGNGQGMNARLATPNIAFSGPIFAIGEPDRGDIVLPAAEQSLRKTIPPVAAPLAP
jgi:hypothetical protein